MKRKSLGLNAFLNSIKNIMGILFPLITFPYVTRVLSVDGIGKYNFSNSVVSYFLLIAGLGINTYAIREGAKYRNNETKITNFASEILTINVFSMFVAYILLFVSLVLFAKLHNYISCILIFSIQIFFSVLGVEWLFTIFEDFAYITLRSIFFQIFSIILLFIFVRKSNDYLNYAAITVFSSVGSNVLNFLKAKKEHKIHLVFKFNWKQHMVPIVILFAANIANMIYVSSDITILGLIKNNYVVGIYTVSSKIYSIVKTLISAILLVTVPRLSMLLGQKRIKEYNEILENLTQTLILFTLPVMTGLFMLSKEVILIISGYNFLRATSSLRILCLAYIFCILGWILNDCVLIPAKREKSVLVSMCISAVLNIVLNILLIPFFSENAAAFSTVVAELCMFIVNYHFSQNMVKNVMFTNKLYKNFLAGILGCLGIILICVLCNIGIKSLIFKTIASVFLSVGIYLAILVFCKNEIAMNVLKSIRDRIS